MRLDQARESLKGREYPEGNRKVSLWAAFLLPSFDEERRKCPRGMSANNVSLQFRKEQQVLFDITLNFQIRVITDRVITSTL